MQQQFGKFVRSTRAQGMVEYILIVALIALVAIVGIRMFGNKISKLFSDKATQIENEVGTPQP
jgi:Flp pilus assembly pilin Flp